MAEDCAPVGEGDYVVQEGDSVVSIAAAAGLLPDTIWNDPANAALKKTRKDGEVLLPGDRVAVTPIRAKLVDGATGKRHVFRRKNVPVTVTLYVQDEEGAPFAGKKYEMSIEGTVHSGTTGDDGKIEVPIDPTDRLGELTVWLEEPGLPSPWTVDVHLGDLYPIEHAVGVRQRLTNLGFAGAADDVAVAAFQAQQRLTVGDVDQPTRDKLLEIHKV